MKGKAFGSIITGEQQDIFRKGKMSVDHFQFKGDRQKM